MEYHPIGAIFPLMAAAELAALSRDIAEHGLLAPIMLLDNQILDGRNRYLACQEAGVQPRYTTYAGDSPVSYVLSENLHRRHLTISQKAALGAEIEPLLAAEAKKRREATGKDAPRNDKGQLQPVVAKLPPPGKGKSRDQAAALVGVSARQISSAKAIKKKSPTLFEGVRAGTKTLRQAGAEIHRSEMAQQAQLPSLKYRVLYADPPWKYGDQLTETYGPTRFHYPAMAISELCALPIAGLCEDNAVLFLWVTSPILEESFQVVKAWGFKYKASFVWDKIKHNLGHYNSVRHEFLLICTRGSCHPDVPELIDSVQSIERAEHSRKPEEFRQIIERLYPHGKRLELFARGDAPAGWETWGNESEQPV